MRAFKSKFTRRRGLLRRRGLKVQRDIKSAMVDWMPWISAPSGEIDRFREKTVSRLTHDAGLQTLRAELAAESDWRAVLDQRERENNAFRSASVPLPNFEFGARVPSLYPGEPAPTFVRPEFLNQIHEEIRAAIESSRSRCGWWKFEWLRRVRTCVVRLVRGL